MGGLNENQVFLWRDIFVSSISVLFGGDVMPAGRPLKFDNVEDMRGKIDLYFAECIKELEPPTIAGLAYALDICTHTLRNYEKDDQFFTTIKRAKQLVEISWEKQLRHGGSGAIFWLKNNAGWKDKSEKELSGALGIVDLSDKTDEELAAIINGTK